MIPLQSIEQFFNQAAAAITARYPQAYYMGVAVRTYNAHLKRAVNVIANPLNQADARDAVYDDRYPLQFFFRLDFVRVLEHEPGYGSRQYMIKGEHWVTLVVFGKNATALDYYATIAFLVTNIGTTTVDTIDVDHVKVEQEEMPSAETSTEAFFLKMDIKTVIYIENEDCCED